MTDYTNEYNIMKHDPDIIVIEISKQHTKSKQEAIIKGNFNGWTKDRIIALTNFGHGTMKKFREYMDNNKQYCYFDILQDIDF